MLGVNGTSTGVIRPPLLPMLKSEDDGGDNHRCSEASDSKEHKQRTINSTPANRSFSECRWRHPFQVGKKGLKRWILRC